MSRKESAETFNSNDVSGMRSDVDSVEKITKDDIDEVFEGGWLTDENDTVSYLESMTYIPGGVAVNYDEIGEFKNGKWVSIGSEFRKVNACNRTAIGLRGRVSNDLFYKFIFCYRWMCEKCGTKGGRINSRRFSQIIKKLNSALLKRRYIQDCKRLIDLGDGSLNLRQFVFTVPKDLREHFMSKEGMTALSRMAERIIKKEFPNTPSIRYFHAFGEKDRGIFNPHVNIHCFEIEKKILALSAEQLKAIKIRWGWALMGYLRTVKGFSFEKDKFEKVDIHYSFVESDKVYKRKKWNKEKECYQEIEIPGLNLLIHRIEYMSRPCPGYEDLESIKQNIGLLKLFVVDMKGYHYITNCGSWKVQDIDRKEEMKEAETLAGEPLRLEYDKDGKPLYITRAVFDMKYKYWNYDQLSEGFYRIKKKS